MELILYNQQYETANVRILETDHGIRFVALDVCKAIGYKDGRKSWHDLKRRNPDLSDETSAVKMPSVEGATEKEREMDVLTLEGLYMVCWISKTDHAKNFRKWAKSHFAESLTSFKLPTDIKKLKTIFNETKSRLTAYKTIDHMMEMHTQSGRYTDEQLETKRNQYLMEFGLDKPQTVRLIEDHK